MRLGLIIAAVTVYVAVLGCVIFPSQSSGRSPQNGDVRPYRAVSNGAILTGLPYRGVAVQLNQMGLLEQYKTSLKKIADVGFDTVLFVVDSRQENGSSSRIYLDQRISPSPRQLSDLIQAAKGHKLRVILMPIVLLDLPRSDTEWRGTIQPLDWENWFNSYRDMIHHFAVIAEENKVDVFVVGSELVSTQDKVAQWTRTINAARRIYKGQLTYSSNWDNYMHVPFWNQLDLVGMNSYWSLGKDKNASVEEICGRWKKIQNEVLAFTRKQGKPLLFLEAGWCSLENAAHEPWDYTRTDLKLDLDLQRRLYEGFFLSWYGNPELGGFMMWAWEPHNEGGIDPYNPETDKGYTPEGKPAEKVLRNWLAKPWK